MGTVQTTSGSVFQRGCDLCDFGDMTPHTLVDVAQTTQHPHSKGQRSGGSSKRPKGGLGTPRGSRGHPDTQSQSRLPPPPEALDRCAGVTGAIGTGRNTRQHSWSHVYGTTNGGKKIREKQRDLGFAGEKQKAIRKGLIISIGTVQHNSDRDGHNLTVLRAAGASLSALEHRRYWHGYRLHPCQS